MKKIAFKVFYLGTNYHGLQSQPNMKTIEGEIKKSLIKEEYINDLDYGGFNYSSRTDTGVHAVEQIVSFETDKKIIIPQINHSLPQDIIFWASSEVDSGFNPRYDVLSRHYKYIFVKDYRKFDFNLMKKVAKLFIGVHDFTNFSKSNKKKNPFREILECEISDNEEFYVFDIVGKSFLRQMVRRMVNAILEVGLSQIPLERIEELLENNSIPKKKIGPAPLEPRGSLILFSINTNYEFMIDEYYKERMKRMFENKIREHSLKKKMFNIFLNKIFHGKR
ncbi:MAG: tRNA pseudouridine(38-40) synthase TruA [Candidatus Helarchaeota archaeon]